jgi:hypothetical protein
MDSAGAKSVMSNDMKEITEGKEEISNVIRGYKANLSNPSKVFCPFVGRGEVKIEVADLNKHQREV